MKVDNTTTQATRREIVFVEDNISDFKLLLAAMRSGMDLVLLDHTKDGLAQAVQALQGRGQYDAIHILSHGGVGQIDLGVLRLEASNLGEHAADLRALGASLHDGGDILLYGCDVAEGAAGELFTQQLAQMTQADVAASNNMTGGVEKGGDWQLEAATGNIDTQALQFADYSGLLVNLGGPSGAVTLNPSTSTNIFVGATLNAITSAISDPDGIPSGFHYQWRRAPNLQTDAYTVVGTDSASYTLTQADYDNQVGVLVTYVDGHTNSETIVAFWQAPFSAVTPTKVAPAKTSLGVNSGATFNEDTVLSVTSSMLEVHNLGTAESSIEYIVTAVPTKGKLEVNTSGSWRQITSAWQGVEFTQADITAGKIRYTPNADYFGADSFGFRANKNGDSTLVSGTFALSVSAVNDAPGGTFTLNNIATLNQGATLTATDAITDKDGIGTRSYTWERSSDGSSGWTAISGATGTSYVVTNADGGQYLRAVATYTDTGGTDESVPTTASAKANSIPQLSGTGIAVNEDSGVAGVTTAMLSASDAEDGAAQLTYKVTALPLHGKLYKSAAQMSVNQTFTQQDLVNNAITFRPDDEYSGSDSASYTVSDTRNATVAGTLNITVTAVDDAPTVGANTGLTLLEDAAAVTIDTSKLSISDIDTAAGARVLTVTSVPSFGVFKVGSTALGVGSTFTQADIAGSQLTFTPNANANGAGSLGFTYADATTTSAAQTFSVTVNAVNDAPGFTKNDLRTVLEDSTDNVIGNSVLVAADIDNAVTALTFTVTSLPAKGTLKLDTATVAVGTTFTQADVDAGKLKFTPTADAYDADAFGFTVTDGAGGSTTATFSLFITNTNDAPSIAQNTGKTLGEDAGAVTIAAAQLALQDPDHGPIDRTFTVDRLPAKGTLAANGTPLAVGGTFTQADINAGNLTFTPSLNQNGSDSFEFSFSDGVEALNTGHTFNLTISAVNDAPTLSVHTALTVLEDSGANTLGNSVITAADVDNAVTALTYTLNSVPAKGVLKLGSTTLVAGNTFTQADVDGGTLKFTPDANAFGADGFDLTITDGAGGSTPKTVAISITAVDDAPTLTNTALTLTEDDATTVIPAANLGLADIDTANTARVFTVTSLPGKGTLQVGSTTLGVGSTFTQADIDGSNLKITPTANAFGADSFGFSYTDGTTTVASNTFSLNITAVNDAPTLSVHTALTVVEDSGANTLGNGVITAADVDTTVTALTYTVNSVPAKGVLKLGSTTLVAGNTFTQADVDGGTLKFTPDGNEYGSDSFNVTITDGAGGSTPKTVAITITAVDDAPTLTNAALTLTEDDATTVIPAANLGLADIDTANTARVFTVTSLPAKGTLQVGSTTLGVGSTFTQADIDGSNLKFTPAANAFGADSFGFSYTDGTTTVAGNTFSLNITAVNDAPTLSVHTALTVVEDSGANTLGNSVITAADVDNAVTALTYTLNSVPAKGVLKLGSTTLVAGNTFTQADVDGGTLKFTPDANAFGADGFDLTITDGAGGSTPKTVAIAITAVDDAPTLTNAALTLTEDDATTVIPAANLGLADIDTANTARVFTVTSLPAKGSLQVGSTTLGVGSTFTQADIDGSNLKITPTANAFGADSFGFGYTDGTTTVASNTFSLNITAVNDAPTLSVLTALTVVEDSGANTLGNSVITAADVDNAVTALTYTLNSVPAKGVLKLGSTTLVAGNTFTQADVDGGTLKFTPDANAFGADGFDLTITDGAGGSTPKIVAIAITAVDDAPTLTNAALTLTEDDSATAIPLTSLALADIDTANTARVFNLTSLPAKGTLTVGSTTLGVGSTFTQADIDGGNLKFTPAANAFGADSFGFGYTDGTTTVASNTFSLSITAVNDAPVLTNNGLTLTEDDPATAIAAARLALADVDTADTARVFTVTSLPGKGTLKVGSTVLAVGGTFTQADIDGGNLKFTPTAETSGSDGFGFDYTDGNTTVTGNTFSLNITAVNDAPTLTNNALTLTEDDPATVIPAAKLALADIDTPTTARVFTVTSLPAKGALTVGSTTLGVGGTFTQADIDGGTLKFTPGANAFGADGFGFDYTDGGTTVTGNTFSLGITAVNDAPVLTNNALTLTEDDPATAITAANLALADVDTANTARVFTVTSLPGKGTLKVGSTTLGVGGTFTQADIDASALKFTPTAETSGGDSFGFDYTDGNTTVTGRTFSLSITAVNDAPTLTNNALTLTEDDPTTAIAATSLALADVDTANTARVFTVTSLPAKGTLAIGATPLSVGGTFTQADIDGGNLKFTPAANAFGADSFGFDYTDGNTSVAGNTFSLGITAVNDAPTLTNTLFTVTEDAAATAISATHLALADVDTANTARVFTVTSLPGKGTLKVGSTVLAAGGTFTQADIDGGNLKFTPTAETSGGDSFGFDYTDGNTTVTGRTFSIAITNVDDAPALTNTLFTLTEDAGATAIPAANLALADVDTANTARVFTVTSLPAKGTLTNGATTLAVGATFTQADIDGGNLKFTPGANANGSDAFGFDYTDGNTTVTGNTFSLAITAVNDAPTLTNTLFTLTEDDAATAIPAANLALADIDTADTARVFTVTSLPVKGTLKAGSTTLAVGSTFTQADIDGGNLKFTPTAETSGSDSFGFDYTDGTTNVTGNTFSIAITNVDDAPVLTNNLFTVTEDAAATAIPAGTLALADVDTAATARVFTLTSVPAKGVLQNGSTTLAVGGTFTQADINANALKFTPTTEQNGADSFTFDYTDGHTSVAGTTFSLSITAVNDAPVLTNTLFTVTEDAAATAITTTNLALADADTADTARVFTVTSLPVKGTLKVGSTALAVGDTFTQADIAGGNLKFTPTAETSGSDGFGFDYTDGNTTVTGQTFGIAITNVDDAPVLTNTLFTVTEDAAATTIPSTNLALADVDTAATARVFTVASLPAKGTLKVGSTVLAVGSTFTQADINANALKFTPTAEMSGADSFDFDYTDGTTTVTGRTFSLSITAVNDAPTLTNNALTLTEDDPTTVIPATSLALADVDTANTARVFTVTSLPTKGTLALGSTALAVGGTFTQADIDGSNLKFTPAANANGADSFGFDYTDGATTVTGNTFSLGITAVNDAPVLTNTLFTVTEDAGATTITATNLALADVDTANTARVFTVTALPVKGTLKVGATTLAVGGTFTQADIDGGNLKFTPTAETSGTDSFDFDYTDGNTTVTGRTFSIAITDVNDAPVLTNNGLTLTEDDPTTVIPAAKLSLADPDTANTARVFTVTSLPVKGTLALGSTALTVGATFTQADIDGSNLKFTPAANANGADSFGFDYTDGGTTVTGNTFSLGITAVNDAPALTNALFTVTEDAAATAITATNLALADVDTADTARVFTVTSLPVKGTLKLGATALGVGGTFTQADIDGGALKFTPTAETSGADSFGFDYTDGNTTVTGQTFSIAITNVNDAPTLTNTALSLTEDDPATVISATHLALADVDTANTARVFTVTSLPAKGTLKVGSTALSVGDTFTQADIDGSNLKFTPAANANGADSFGFDYTDGGTTVTGNTFSLGITAVNDAPVLTNTLFTVTEDAAATAITTTNLALADADTADTARVFTVTSLPVKGTLKVGSTALAVGDTFTQADIASGNLKFTPTAETSGSDGFGFDYTDGNTTVTGQTFGIAITNVDDAPVLTNTLFTVTEDAAATTIPSTNLALADVDTAATARVFTVASLPAKGTLKVGSTVLAVGSTFTQADINANALKFTPTAEMSGADSFDFDYTDGSTTVTGRTFSLSITAVNDAPTLTNNALTLTEDDPTTVIPATSLALADVDTANTARVFTVTSLPTKGTLALGSTALAVGGTFTQADIDGSNLKFTPAANANGTDSFGFDYTDGATTVTGNTFSLGITAVNDAPVLTNTLFTVTEDAGATTITATNLALADVDTANTARVFTVTALPVKGTLKVGATTLAVGGTFTQADIDGGNLKFTPTAETSGTDSFDFDYTDGNTTVTGRTFSIAITDVNDAPVLTNNGLTLTEDDPTTVIPAAKLALADPDTANTARVFTVTSLPVKGTLALGSTALTVGATFTQADIDGSNLKFTPAANANGADSFGFDYTDGGTTVTGNTFSLGITAVNDAPALTNTLFTVTEDAAATAITATNLALADVDTADTARVFTVTSLPVKGTLKLGATALGVGGTFTQADIDGGALKFTPTAETSGADSFGFSYTDGNTNVTGQTFSIAITNVDDAPVLTNTLFTVTEDASATVIPAAKLALADVDTAATARVFTVTSLPAKGVLTNGATTLAVGSTFTQADIAANALKFTPTAEMSGADSFGFDYTDGTTTVTGNTFSLGITAVNDAPVLTNNGLTLTEDDPATAIAAANLALADVDTADTARVFTVTSLPAKGTLKVGATTLAVGGTFTQADIDGGNLKFTPNANANGSDSFGFGYSDGTTTVGGNTFSLTITAVNDAPTLTNTLFTVNEDAAATTITASTLALADVDTASTARVFTVTSLPGKGTLKLGATTLGVGGTFTHADIAANALKFTPTAESSGADSFGFDYTDGSTTVSGNTFNIAITNVDDAPVLTKSTLTLAEDAGATVITSAKLALADVDTADTARVFTVTSLPVKGTLALGATALVVGATFTQADIDASNVNFTPHANASGTDGFGFSYSDGTTTVAGNTFNLSITEVPDAPVLTNAGMTLVEDAPTTVITAASLALADVDTAPSARIYTVTTLPAGGVLKVGAAALGVGGTFTQADVDANKLTFKPSAETSGADGFGFSYTDGATTVAGNVFSLNVTNVDDAPALTNLVLSLPQDAPTTAITNASLRLADPDTAAAARVFTLASLPAKGVLQLGASALSVGATFTQADIDAGDLTFTPTPGADGSDSFGFGYSDGNTTVAGATFSLNLGPPNNLPSLRANAGLEIVEDTGVTTITSQLLAVDDVESAPSARTFVVTSVPAKGVLKVGAATIGLNGTFTQADINAGLVKYTPAANAEGNDLFSFKVRDGNNGVLDGQRFDIAISAVNDHPVLHGSLSLSVEQDAGAVVIAPAVLAAIDADQTSAGLVYSIRIAPGHGVLARGGVAVDTFTQADIEAGLITYRPVDGYSGADGVVFHLSDGQGGLLSNYMLNIRVGEPATAPGPVASDAPAPSVVPPVASEPLLLPPIPVVVPEPPRPPSPPGGGSIGADGVQVAVEAAVPNLLGTGHGDGNGDGIQDSAQRSVTSIPWSVPLEDHVSYVTLMNSENATQTDVKTTLAPEHLPANLSLAMGMLEFRLDAVALAAEVQMTVYVDSALKVNGYWKQNAAGAWVNVADDIVPEGARTRITFTLKDGGEFDHDHTVNGSISDPGGAGYWNNDLDHDQIPDTIEEHLGTVVGVKDNDIVHRDDLKVMQLYRDMLHREGTAAEIKQAVTELGSGQMNMNDLLAKLGGMQQQTIGAVSNMYIAAHGHLMDMNTFDYWAQQVASGTPLDKIADGLVSTAEFRNTYDSLGNSAFLDRLYQTAFHRAPDELGKAFWLHHLDNGGDRGDVLAAFARADELFSADDPAFDLSLAYMTLLGRAPDAGGLEFWVAAYNAGVPAISIIGQFVNSPEYHGRLHLT